MPRTPPARTPERQKTHERLAALASLDVAALRAWAERWGVELQGDDRTLLISMHETRAIAKFMPVRERKESIAWLQAEYPESVVLTQIRAFPR
jgi:hypothetical protein